MNKIILLAALLSSCTEAESFNYYHLQQADVKKVNCYGECCYISVNVDGQPTFMHGSYIHAGTYKWATFTWYERDNGSIYKCTSHYGD